MKRIILGLIFGLSLVTTASTTEYDNLLFFNGIGTKFNAFEYNGSRIGGGDSDTRGIEEQADLMYKKYFSSALASGTSNNKPKVIIAHSQGGVRGLAFAFKYPTATSALITIGSPVKGHPMLLNVQTTKNTITNALNTILYGAGAAIPLVGQLSVAITQAISAGSGFGNTLADQVAGICLFYKVGSNSPNNNIVGILNIAADPSTTKFPGLTDLGASSKFFLQLFDSDAKTGTALVKVKTGTQVVKSISGYETVVYQGSTIKLPTYTSTEQPVYKYAMTTLAYAKNRLPASIFVHFIRGTQNDPLTFLEGNDLLIAKNCIKAYQTITSQGGDGAAGVAAMYTTAAIAAAASGAGAGAAVSLGSLAVVFGTSSAQCYAGNDWVKNYKTNIGMILGDTKNDSFIPYLAQSWDLKNLGGTQIGDYPFSDFVDNHQTEKTDVAIWGSEGSMESGVVGSSGCLNRVMQTLASMGKIPVGDGLTYSNPNGRD